MRSINAGGFYLEGVGGVGVGELVVDGEEEVGGFGEVVGEGFAGPAVEFFEGDVDGGPFWGG